jgi:hypothetical protein
MVTNKQKQLHAKGNIPWAAVVCAKSRFVAVKTNMSIRTKNWTPTQWSSSLVTNTTSPRLRAWEIQKEGICFENEYTVVEYIK